MVEHFLSSSEARSSYFFASTSRISHFSTLVPPRPQIIGEFRSQLQRGSSGRLFRNDDVLHRQRGASRSANRSALSERAAQGNPSQFNSLDFVLPWFGTGGRWFKSTRPDHTLQSFRRGFWIFGPPVPPSYRPAIFWAMESSKRRLRTSIRLRRRRNFARKRAFLPVLPQAISPAVVRSGNLGSLGGSSLS